MKVRFQADAAFKQTIVAASLRRAPQVDSEWPLPAGLDRLGEDHFSRARGVNTGFRPSSVQSVSRLLQRG